MSYTDADLAYDLNIQELEEKAFQQFIEEELSKALEESPKIRIQVYLATNGDAIDRRINNCINKAQNLLRDRDFSLSLVVSVTAIEIVILYFFVKPLLEGAFTDNPLAIVLKKLILDYKNTTSYRRLFQSMLKVVKININEVEINDDDRNLWNTFAGDDGNSIVSKRNKVLHHGESVLEEDALTALKCAKTFSCLPQKLAHEIGMEASSKVKWHEYSIIDINGNEIAINPQSPFH